MVGRQLNKCGSSHQAIILMGPPGSGKTSAGLILAGRLKWSFADTDDLIEKSTGLTVAEIFKTMGEPHFRQLETNLLNDFLHREIKQFVLATGGGIAVTPGNYEILSRLGLVICLIARSQCLAERLQGNTSRPYSSMVVTSWKPQRCNSGLRRFLTSGLPCILAPG